MRHRDFADPASTGIEPHFSSVALLGGVPQMPFPGKLLILSNWTSRLIRIGLGSVFVWASVVKLIDPRAFARSISGYGLLPDPLLVPVAIGLPIVELLAGLGLIFDVRGSLKVVGGLLLIFLSVLGFAIQNNLQVECGCFTPEEVRAHANLWSAFFRDVVLMIGAVYLFYWKRRSMRLGYR